MQYFKNSKNEVYAYDDDCDEKFILSGLISISESEALKLLAPPPPTKEQLQAEAELKRANLRTAADAEIAWRQDAVDAGMATEEEATTLTAWKTYRVLLMRVDITKAPDIEWPNTPKVE